MNWNIAAILLFAGAVLAQELPEIDLENVPEINQETVHQTAEQGEKLLKEKCLKVSGGEDAFKELEGKKESTLTCFNNIVNITQIKEEIEEAKKRGAMEEVFGKYCKQKSELLGCVDDLKDSLGKCLYEGEKDTLKIVHNITSSLLDFMCFKDGDRIAMFIAEGGFKCLEEKKDEVQQCFNETLSAKMPKELSLEAIGLLEITDEKCDDFTKLQECVTLKLEGCENQTPANVMESLFRFIKKSLPCDAKAKGAPTNGVPLFEYNRIKRQAPSVFSHTFRDKCLINAKTPEAFDHLNITFNNFYHCFKDNYFMGSPDDCKSIIENTKSCAYELLPLLKQCLRQDEFFLTEFFMDSLNAVLDFGCDDTGKNLRDFKSEEGLKCLMDNESTSHYRDCLRRSDRHPTIDGQVSIKKDILCNDIDSVRKCINGHIAGSKCKEYKRFAGLADDFMKAVHSPCSATSIFINGILIFGVLFMQIQKYLF